jgi:hypothetical protein
MYFNLFNLAKSSKVDKISDIITNSPLVVKVIVSLYRNHRGENILRNILHNTTKEFLDERNLQLCLNPSDIYKSWINKIETDTGLPSGMPYDVTNQKALEYAEVTKQLEQNIKYVKHFTSKFLQIILKSLHKFPFGLRYIAKVLKSQLRAKFSSSFEREVLKVRIRFFKFG